MINRLVFGICLVGLSSLQAQNNPNWGVLTPKVFDRLDQEIADSIAWRRSESAGIRTEMEKIVVSKGLDRQLIFGSGDMIFKEGLHKNFKEEPRSMYVQVARDPLIVRLENLHISLYHSDKAIFRWQDLQKRMAGYREREDQSKWSTRFNQLPAEQKKVLNDENKQLHWATHEVVCMVAVDLESFSGQNLRTVNSLELSFGLLKEDKRGASEPLSLPLAPDKILTSFPINGQYAFCPDESVRGSGYFVFPQLANALFEELKDKNQLLKARWTGTNGDMTYTGAVSVFNMKGAVVYFSIPKLFFQKGLVYRLELVGLPQSAIIETAGNDVCWQKFRGASSKTEIKPGRISGETLVTEIYFRTSKYALREKLEGLKGTLDLQTGLITYTTDEPFDATELLPSAYAEAPMRLTFASNGQHWVSEQLGDKTLFYYLTVPEIEDLSKLAPNELAVIERDNLLDAVFVREVSKGNAANYIQVPDTRIEPQRLPNGYVVPAYSAVFTPDTLVTDKPVPFISRKHFESKTPVKDEFRCSLIIGELRQMLKAVALQQSQIRSRMEARAAFFYALEQRLARRTGKAPAGDIEYFRKKEQEYLPASAKGILEIDFDKQVRAGFAVLITKSFPGDKQRTAELMSKF